jgi:hypothetical protein
MGAQKAIDRLNEFLRLPDKEPSVWGRSQDSRKWRRGNRFAKRCLRLWIQAQRDLPKPHGLEDKVAAKLLKVNSHKELKPLWAYLAARLRDLATHDRPFAFEHSLAQADWAHICAEANLQNMPYQIREYLDVGASDFRKDIYLSAWEGCIGLTEFWKEMKPDSREVEAIRKLPDEIRKHSEQRVLSLMLRYPGDVKWLTSTYVDLIDRYLESKLKPGLPESPWYAWLRAWAKGITTDNLTDKVFRILSNILDREICSPLLENKSLNFLSYILKQGRSTLIMEITEMAPDKVLQIIHEKWNPEKEWEEKGYYYDEDMKKALSILSASGEALIKKSACTLGYEIGRYCQDKGLDPSDQSLVTSFLSAHGFTFLHLPTDVYQQAKLWGMLRRVVEYTSRWETKTERLGAEMVLQQFVADNPSAWARSLPVLLIHMERFRGIVEALTVGIYEKSADVQSVLKSSVESSDDVNIRDRARGLVALCGGMNSIQEDVAFSFVSQVARLFDGYTSFPHPLEVRSATWLGSLSVESIMRQQIQEAESNFQLYFKQQGGVEEEAPTARLLGEIDFAFRRQQLQVKGLGLDQSRKVPRITFSQMQVPKVDENTYGCDISFILKGNIQKAFRIESADLVQVKKPLKIQTDERKHGRFREAWSIEVSQLNDILEYSQTAVYWLIQPSGQVLVVPSKLLLGIIRGSGKSNQGSVAVGYHQVRSVAISLSQYLIDLFLGLWLGPNREKTLKFARGEETMTKPMHIVEVNVVWGEQG